jgi:hypothetical protein
VAVSTGSNNEMSGSGATSIENSSRRSAASTPNSQL